MPFNTYFRASSYAMVACGALALFVSGGVGVMLGGVFAVALIGAWLLEKTRWQMSERVGLVVVLLSLPLFYVDWKFLSGGVEASERIGVSALTHLTLFLSAVKLLQVKADRDWVFLYLISFFEMLLAAGLSLSPLFLLTLGLYMLTALSTIIAFEIRKARKGLKVAETRLLVAPDSTLFRRLMKRGARRAESAEARRLPLVALMLLVLIFAMALPLFLLMPRYGMNALARTGNGISGVTGFSDMVELGTIGRLQKSDRIVMHVRVENPQDGRNKNLRWRGVALDEFTGHAWHKSNRRGQPEQQGNERGFFQLGTIENLHNLTTQNFFIEPIDTPIIFAAPRAVALQGTLPYLRRDAEGSLSTRFHLQERISYKVYSDTAEPDEKLLRADFTPYPEGFRYLQLPEGLDPRIKLLTRDIVMRAGARNRYDAARAIESYLQSGKDYKYTLELKAGGADPLADFLFNVKEGHCEYFATSLAVMLRSIGIASRVVNGFQTGEYNNAADAYTVRQRDAHSWVEVYFPETDAWVTFDPTPPAGRTQEAAGIAARFNKYAEALELIWIQYVVSYDRQEQRSLATSVGNSFYSYRRAISDELSQLKNSFGAWMNAGQNVGGIFVFKSIFAALFLLLLAIPLLILARRIHRFGCRRAFCFWQEEEKRASVVEFYERMMKALAARGLTREVSQTPLEFAAATHLPEALKITHAYNRVRFGEQHLSQIETAEIEAWLRRMEGRKE